MEKLLKALKSLLPEDQIKEVSEAIEGYLTEAKTEFEKEYEDKHIMEDLEIIGVIGNVATLGDTIMVHAHGTFSDRNMHVLGGHIKKIIVSATGEVMFNKLEGAVAREYDDNTGLNLMKSSQ